MSLYSAGRLIKEAQAREAAKKKQDEIIAAGGIRMSDGNYYMPNEVEVNENGEYTVIGKPGLKGTNPDGSPMRPDNIQVVDKDGNLKNGMAAQFSQVDPNSLEGYNAIKNMAQSQGPTDIAKSQMDMAGILKSQGLDNAVANAAGAQAQARTQMAMRGGASTGARANLARQGMKDILAAKQGVNSQYTTGMANIASEDANRKLDLLRNFGQAEMNLADSNNAIKNQETQFNKNLQGLGIQNANQYRMDAYTAELDKWGAGKQADATRNSGGGGGGGGCCFIFLEARYGNGAMDAVVRRYRDENMTAKNKRGYYKLSEVLVPLMRKSAVVKALVRLTMTGPLVAYGKAHYGVGSKLGFLFAPVKNFWLNVFEYLGEDHEFIRENGEVI